MSHEILDDAEYNRCHASGPTVTLQTNRDDVLRAVWILCDLNSTNFRLKVKFGKDEKDEDDYLTEFIDLAFKALVKPETGLFDIRENYCWFRYHPKMTEELKQKYESVGMLLGIAVSHGRTIPIRFPSYFYKKLLYENIDYTDIKFFDQKVFRALNSLLENSTSEDDCIEFTYVDNLHNYTIDLTDFKYIDNDDNFEPKHITDSNKKDYIQRVTKWIFDESVREPFAAFYKGYQRIHANPLLHKKFTIYEMDNIISGDFKVDWNSLKQSTSYEGYSIDSKVIEWFWRYFDGLSEDKKFGVLKFIRGTTSVPVGGLKNAGIKIKKLSNGDVPIAHTCYSQMELPEYSSYEMLERRFSEIIPNYEWKDSYRCADIFNQLNLIAEKQDEKERREREQMQQQLDQESPYWLQIDFNSRKIQIDNYLIKANNANDSRHTRSWWAEISNDGTHWEKIDEQIEVTDLNGNDKTKSFKVEMTKPFRFFRLISNKPNFQNDDGYVTGKLELFSNIVSE